MDSELPEQYADSITEYDLFIDGEFRAAESTDIIEVSFPYSGEVWATAPDGSEADVDAAVEAARSSFSTWRNSKNTERRRILHQVGDTLENHHEELGQLETLQNGKLIHEMESQIKSLGEWYHYYAGLADSIEGSVIPVENKDGGFFNYTVKEPYGVVGAITPWNSPLLITTLKLAPALAAGNTFVHKPSEYTPVSALRFAELLKEETDLPDGVYNVVTGFGGTGAALSTHQAIDKLAFTGSSETGAKIAESGGHNLIPVTLELGGKSPNIVFPDANLDNVVNGVIKGIFAATGQTCLAGSRVLVHTDIYETFLERLIEQTEEIKIGNPLDHTTEMGPVAFKNQWEKVMGYIDIAKQEDVTIALGGDNYEEAPGELFVKPTILTDVDNDMEVAQEEIFGPVASIITFDDEEEAVEIANDIRYGLATGVWTEDMRRANRLATQIEAGTIWINEYRTISPKSPFGGYKDSGIGREMGEKGLEEYLQTKSVWMDISGHVEDPFSLI